MPAFFIDRPVFAWVVALLICLGGLLAIPFLAVAQYPIIAPPSISISTSYPGASPENLYNSVTRLIEEELNGANGILNFESTSDSLGQVEITANFVPGTNSERRLGRGAKPHQARRSAPAARRHPAGHSDRGSLERGAADHHAALDRRQPRRSRARRLPGAQRSGRNPPHPGRRPRHALFAPSARCAIWIDPTGWSASTSTADDVTKAISAQNAQVASGSIGVEPSNAAPADFGDGPGQGPIRLARGVRRHRSARQRGRLDCAAARRGPDRSRRPELSVHHAPQRRAGRRAFGAARAQRQRACHGQRRQGEDGGAVEVLSRRISNTTSPTTSRRWSWLRSRRC